MDRIFFILFIFVECRFVKRDMDGQDGQDIFYSVRFGRISLCKREHGWAGWTGFFLFCSFWLNVAL